MKGGIEEFVSKEKPEGYYIKLTEDLEKLNSKFHIFSSINKEISAGLPFSVKDNICVMDVESTASSEILSGYVPPFDATAVGRLRGSEFGFIGKTKMDEFGFGTFGTNCKGHPLNPIDDRYITGGSSAGSAAAAAVMKYHVSIAESTGGSISCPASFCGVVGFTPTYGVVSRYGLIDYANSLDKIGIIARNSSDIKYVFDKIKGSDEYDTTCGDAKISNLKKGKLIVVDQLLKGVDKDILGAFDRLLSNLQNMGYSVEHWSIPFLEKSIPAYYIISMAEASTNLAKYTGFKYGKKVTDFSMGYNEFFMEARNAFGIEAKRRVVLGTFVRSASVKSKYYEKALKLRQMLISALSDVLKDGFIISPTMPIKVPEVKEVEEMDPVSTYRMDSITVPPNLAGLPHISFPYDYINGFPLGAQLVTSHFNDYALLDFTEAWEGKFEYKFKYNLGSL
ncbi:MAG: amidase family protein [Candidatus Marsarchaeota archaeon]|nr:amidase family protein [Candidatus Marsarchaeota archaeon]